MEGYIKDYRQELDSDIWSMPPLYHRIWQYIKYSANHAEKNIPMSDGSFIKIKPGQKLTSYRNIAKNIGWYDRGVFKEPNVKTVQNIIEWLQDEKMILIEHGKSNRQYTLISVVNWAKYQGAETVKVTESIQPVYSQYTAGIQTLDINKNVKECLKNDKECSNKSYICVAPAENSSGDEGAQEEVGKGSNAQAENSQNSDGAQPLTGKGKCKREREEYSSDFEKFWSLYPKQIEKKKAYAAWNKTLKKEAKPDDIIQACINYTKLCNQENKEPQFIKHAATFLGPNEPYKEFVKGCPIKPALNYKNIYQNHKQKEYDIEAIEKKLLGWD